MRRDEIDRSLAAALSALRDETSGAVAPERVRDSLRWAVRSRKKPVAQWWRAAIAAAVLIAFGFTLARWIDGDPRAAARRQTVQPATWLPPEPGDGTLSPWFYNTGLPAPRSAQVVRVAVEPETARRFGIVRPPAALEAEVLIGDDGLARAIRFVRNIDGN